MEEVKHDRRLSDYRVDQLEKQNERHEIIIANYVEDIVSIKARLNILIMVLGFVAVMMSGNIFYFSTSIHEMKDNNNENIAFLSNKHNIDVLNIYEKINKLNISKSIKNN